MEEQKAIDSIANFCMGKSKTNFCSDVNLKYMIQALKIQNEEREKIQRLIEAIKLQSEAKFLRNQKLRNFLFQNPKYKMVMEFDTPRFI